MPADFANNVHYLINFTAPWSIILSLQHISNLYLMKKHNVIFALAIMIFQVYSAFAHTFVPGEFILVWKNKAAADRFTSSAFRTAREESYFARTILQDDVYWQHVVVNPENAEGLEKEWRSDPDILHIQKNKYLEERTI